MIKRKNIIKVAIDSPAAAGAGTLAKAISKHYKLFYLDTGKIYRFIAFIKLKNPKKLFVKGAQNIFVQLYYRYKYNKNISNWLDSFLDQYFLKKT